MRARVLIVLDGVHESGFDAELGQPLAEELGSAAVDVALGHDVVATFQQGEHGGGDGVHAGSEEQSGIGAFEFRNRLFSHGVGRVSVAGVEHVGGGGAHLLIVVRDFE